jgi:hypothetical protein
LTSLFLHKHYQVQKNGTGEHVPPPRPKRKSATPYPQKSFAGPGQDGARSSKKQNRGRDGTHANGTRPLAHGAPGDIHTSQRVNSTNHVGPSPMGGALVGGPMEYGGPLRGGGYLVHPRGSGGLGALHGGVEVHNAGNPRWAPSPSLPQSFNFGAGGYVSSVDGGAMGRDVANNAGVNNNQGLLHDFHAASRGSRGGNQPPMSPMHRKHPTSNPDFVVVYTFLAQLFDPTRTDHRRVLKQMTPIDRETTLLLMRNLGANLMCQRMWEDQIQLIGAGYPTFVNASYDERGGVLGSVGSGAITGAGSAVNRQSPDTEDTPSDAGHPRMSDDDETNAEVDDTDVDEGRNEGAGSEEPGSANGERDETLVRDGSPGSDEDEGEELAGDGTDDQEGSGGDDDGDAPAETENDDDKDGDDENRREDDKPPVHSERERDAATN